MSSDDHSKTTSWDGREIQRQSGSAGDQKPQDQPHTDSAGKSTVKKKKRKKKKRMNPLLALVLWVAIVAVSSMAAASLGWMLANDFAALNKNPNGIKTEVSFQVQEDWVKDTETVTNEDGSTTQVTHYDMEKVAAALKEDGLIKYDWFFRLFAWFYHADTKIEQGSYTLHTEMDYMALIRSMKPGRSNEQAETVDVTIPEGYTVAQIIALLEEKGVGTKESLTETAANYIFDSYAFVDNENLGDISRLEGYLFPDTYNFYVGGRPERVFNSMLSNFKSKIYDNEDLVDLFSQAEEAGYDLADIITIASLIEKETDGSDRSRIASVIYNRLEHAGETYYYLQIDAALVYAAGREITREDYDHLDSPYNLYQHTGLPPTPIANPGRASIAAALQPADTNYYFYTLGHDGKHIFNETLAGHNKTLDQLANGN